MAVPGRARFDGRARDQRHADPLVPRQCRARARSSETAFRNAGRGGGGLAARRAGLVMLPYFSGERTPIHDPHAKGVIFGLNLTHTRGDIYRALLEGIAFGTNHIFETYREIGADAEKAARRRRRHEEPCLVAGDVRYFRSCRRLCCEQARSAPATATPSSRRSPSATSRRATSGAWNPDARRIAPRRETPRRLSSGNTASSRNSTSATMI